MFKVNLKSSTAVQAPVADASDEGGLGAYNAAEFASYEFGKYRERFPVETADLADSQIWGVVAGTDDDQDDDGWKALFAACPRVETNLDGDALAEHARALGAKAGAASNNAVLFVMKAKEEWIGGTFRVLFGLKVDYTDEELVGFAVPDSDTGNNPDEFKVTREDAKGKKKKVLSSFYVNFADGTATGQDILANIEWAERAGNVNMVKDDIPAEIMEMSPHEREVHLNYLKGRRTTIRAAYKKAMALYFKDREVNEYPGVKAEPMWVKGKSPDDVDFSKGELPEVENTTKPIQVWLVPDKNKDGSFKPIAKWQAFSIGSFLKLNVKKAIEKGGTFAALVESGATKKKPGKGGKAKATEGLTIKTLETGIAVLAEFHRWAEEIGAAKDKAEVGKLYKLLNAKDNDELIVAIVETAASLKAWADDTGAGQKYLNLQKGGSDLVSKVSDKAAAK